MRFSASAPCKAILFGEHYVVYGAPALSLPIEPRNRVVFTDWGGGGISLHSEFGFGTISGDGFYDGPEELEIYQAVATAIFPNGGIPSCSAQFVASWKLKGVGTSASFCAAFAAGLLRAAEKPQTAEGIFVAAQAGDLVAHGGRASGIDAKTVSYGVPLVFQRSFEPPAFNSRPAGFSLPGKTALLLIDTYRGKKEGTGRMLEIFAEEAGINGTPAEATEEERGESIAGYMHLWKTISKALPSDDAGVLGKLMNENHALLRERKMASPGIELAVSEALSAGAYGAKLTGGGGEGGAVLALCNRGDLKAISQKISDAAGFACHPLALANRGACVD